MPTLERWTDLWRRLGAASTHPATFDVDLSILGAASERFDEYERQIRAEYAWVPGVVFRAARRKLLQGFLARPSIFSTARLISAYEARARANLQRALERLEPR